MKVTLKYAEKQARYWAKKAAKMGSNQRSNQGGSNHEKEKEKKEEASPHTPYKEKKEEEKEAAALLCSRHGANGDEMGATAALDDPGIRAVLPQTPKERAAFVAQPPSQTTFLVWGASKGITDTKWLVAKWEQLEASYWCDIDGVLITNWPLYVMAAFQGKEIHRKKKDRVRGAYMKLPPDIKTMFDAFWSDYPRRRRTGKDNCADLFHRILVESGDPVATFNKISDGLKAWLNSWDWRKQNGEYAMMPYRWLYNSCWETPPTGGRATERRRGISQTANYKTKEVATW